MATDKKLSELPLTSSVGASDSSIVIKNGVDYQFAFNTLLEFIGAELTVGATISFGTALPQNISGKNGDVFINTTAGTLTQRIAGTWTIVYTFPTGNPADSTVLYGTSIPGITIGKNGDTFINTLSGIFYKRLADTWSQVFSMQTGPAGATGPAGPTGAAGANGKTILSEAGAPSNLYTGTNGDYYINTTNYVFYGPKANGVWPAGFTLDNSEGEAIAAETAARVAADAGLQAQVNGKIDAADGFGLSQNNYTTIEKNKLANLSEHFKGSYTSFANLTTSNPAATNGDYAFVDEGVGENAKMYIWDENDSTWVMSLGGGTTPDATEAIAGILEIATTTEALNRLDDQRAMTALKTNALILDEKKKVSYQINPVGLNEVSILMENSGQVNSVLISGADNAKLKIGLSGIYPVTMQTYPFTYNSGDRVFITYNYTDLNHTSCNIKLKCQDN